jgi:hypothetical protein
MVQALIILALLFAPSLAWATFPVQASTAQSQEDTATTTHDITMPSGITAGDLLIAWINFLNASNADPAASGLTGWTQVCAVTNSDTSFGSVTEIWRKFASGSETNTTYSSSASVESVTRVMRFTGAHAATPPECATNEFTGDFPNTPTLTASWGAEDNLWYSLFSKYNGSDSITAYPTNYATYQYGAGGGTVPVQLGAAARELNATNDNPDGYSLDGAGNGVGITLVIRPASAAVTDEPDAPIFFQ